MRKLTLVFALLLASVYGEDSFGIDLGIDFIYWKPCIGDLDYALKSAEIVNPDSPAPIDPQDGPVVGRYRYLDPRGQGGVRVRLGSANLTRGWDFFLSYTYAAGANAKGVQQLPSGHVWPTLMHGAHSFAASSVFSEYRLHYQAFDALFSHAFECQGGCFEPFFGFDSLYLFQELNSETADAVNNILGSSRWTSALYGAGLKIGCLYTYLPIEGIGVYTKISGSVLAADDSAHFKSERENIESGLNLVVGEGILKIRSREKIIVPGFTLAAGAFYKIEDMDFRAGFHFGYEFVQWFNIPRQRRYPKGGAEFAKSVSHFLNSFGFHGVTVGFDVGF